MLKKLDSCNENDYINLKVFQNMSYNDVILMSDNYRNDIINYFKEK